MGWKERLRGIPVNVCMYNVSATTTLFKLNGRDVDYGGGGAATATTTTTAAAAAAVTVVTTAVIQRVILENLMVIAAKNFSTFRLTSIVGSRTHTRCSKPMRYYYSKIREYVCDTANDERHEVLTSSVKNDKRVRGFRTPPPTPFILAVVSFPSSFLLSTPCAFIMATS
jgi:hypothetical protein